MPVDLKMNITYKGILKLAIPISVGTFIQFLVVFTDNIFLSEVGKNVMNGAGNGSLMYVSLLMLLIGLASGLQILIARRQGARSWFEAGEIFANALLVAFIIAISIFGLLQFGSRVLLKDWISSPEIYENMSVFINIRSIGILFYFFTLMAIGFYTGIARTMVVLYATVMTAGINIILDWILIFGKWGIPAMGIEGASWATVIAEVIATVFTIVFMLRDKGLRKYGIMRHLKSLPWIGSKRLLRISVPIMTQQMISLSTWTFFFIIIEKSGEDNLQISHVIRTLYMLIFVSAMGFGQATKSVVSTLIAEQRQNEIFGAIRKLIISNLIGILILSHGLWLYPDWISEAFNLSPSVYENASKSMLVILFSMILVSFSSILLNVIIGSGKTMAGFVIEIFAVIMYLTMAYIVTIKLEWPIYKIWTSDYIYFGVIMVLSFLYIKYSNWKYVKL